jgi:hypothetical protein
MACTMSAVHGLRNVQVARQPQLPVLQLQLLLSGVLLIRAVCACCKYSYGRQQRFAAQQVRQAANTVAYRPPLQQQ